MRPWMGVSHPNILQLVAVEIKHDTGVVSKMTTNGNILDYNNVNEADRLRLVRSLVVTAVPENLVLLDFFFSLRSIGAQARVTGDGQPERWHRIVDRKSVV